MEFSEFVNAYKSGRIRVHIDRSQAMHVCDHSESLPKSKRLAHALWKNVSVFLILGGLLSLFWLPWWQGLGASFFGIVIAPAVQKSAAQFVLEHSMEDAEFFSQMIETGVLQIEPVNG